MTEGAEATRASLTTVHLSGSPNPRTFHDTTRKFLKSFQAADRGVRSPQAGSCCRSQCQCFCEHWSGGSSSSMIDKLQELLRGEGSPQLPERARRTLGRCIIVVVGCHLCRNLRLVTFGRWCYCSCFAWSCVEHLWSLSPLCWLLLATSEMRIGAARFQTKLTLKETFSSLNEIHAQIRS